MPGLIAWCLSIALLIGLCPVKLKCSGQCRLPVAVAVRLVLATPEARTSKMQGGCVSAEVLSLDSISVVAQVRNDCPKSGSGMIGNYVISRRDGSVRLDQDNAPAITSSFLKKLTRSVLRDCSFSGTEEQH